MKILTVDIENRPNLAYVWGLWDQNVGLTQLVEAGETISFAAKWHGKKEVLFYSVHHHGKEEMLAQAHRLLSEADVVVGYNSKNFDMKHLNKEFILAGMSPPEPYAQVDLLNVVRKQFKFPSNKLDYVSQALQLGAKTSHSGFELWRDCMEGKEKAWNLMRKYNKQDVVLTEKLYDRLLPWIPSHPTVGLYVSFQDDTCPNCGSDDLQKRGFAYTKISKFQQYVCKSCGAWSRSGKRVEGIDLRSL